MGRVPSSIPASQPFCPPNSESRQLRRVVGRLRQELDAGRRGTTLENGMGHCNVPKVDQRRTTWSQVANAASLLEYGSAAILVLSTDANGGVQRIKLSELSSSAIHAFRGR
jgi:hypothetical protein